MRTLTAPFRRPKQSMIRGSTPVHYHGFRLVSQAWMMHYEHETCMTQAMETVHEEASYDKPMLREGRSALPDKHVRNVEGCLQKMAAFGVLTGRSDLVSVAEVICVAREGKSRVCEGH